MTGWREVHDSRQERPTELDTSSSGTIVYERRSIRQETRSDPMGGDAAEVMEWVYEQREYTREEWAAMNSPATKAILEAVAGVGDRVDVAAEQTQETRREVKTLNAAAEVTFVVMAEAGQIDAVTAAEHADLFTQWAYPVAYKAGQIRRYTDGKLYKCLQDHTSQEDWTPPSAVSLWAAVADPAEEWPEWSQPLGAHDAYNTGDKVSHNGKHWTCDIDGNVWEPGVYGWTEEPAGD